MRGHRRADLDFLRISIRVSSSGLSWEVYRGSKLLAMFVKLNEQFDFYSIPDKMW